MNLQLTDEEAVIVHRACKAMMLHLAENLGNPIPEDARPTVKTIDDLKQKIEGQLQANGIDPQMNIPPPVPASL